jgi:hypothetical protein
MTTAERILEKLEATLRVCGSCGAGIMDRPLEEALRVAVKELEQIRIDNFLINGRENAYGTLTEIASILGIEEGKE